MGPDTREALIAQHMGLVRHVASRWAAMGGGVLDRDDLVGYGTIGLIEAVDRYDYERGNGFASYAIHRIRGAMLDAARSLDPLPRTVRRRVSQVDRARSALTPSLGREPLREELCNAAGLTEGEYRDAMTVASRMAISLESLVGQDDGNRDNPGFLQPTDPADDAFTGDIETRELLDDLAEAIARLPERERLVVTLYFKEGLDLREVAAVLDVSASRISQLKTRALGKLRVALQWHEAAA
jgi:RNA polymerase sigma factor for flagellar operon FliA